MADQTALAREKMVDSQIRPNQVNDRRVIAALRQLPREAFAPAGALAYADADIPLGRGRFMLSPMVTARLAQLVLSGNPAHVLVVGAGGGYLAAVLAACGVKIVALDEADLLHHDALARYAPQAEVVSGRLAYGWPAGGPYDAIVIEGAVPKIPQGFIGQLTPAGRIVTILADGPEAAGIGRAVIAEPSEGGYAVVKIFDCTARILPEFALAPEFIF